MSLKAIIPAGIVILWVFLRTLSFAAWNWKNKNKSGSFMVLLVGAASVALPVYTVFFKK